MILATNAVQNIDNRDLFTVVGGKSNINSHSLRKTWVYHTLMDNRDDFSVLNLIMTALNHSSQAMTLRYATITNDEINQKYDEIGKMYLGLLAGDSGFTTKDLIEFAYRMGVDSSGAGESVHVSNLEDIFEMMGDVRR